MIIEERSYPQTLALSFVRPARPIKTFEFENCCLKSKSHTKYSARRLIESLWANIKVITITE